MRPKLFVYTLIMIIAAAGFSGCNLLKKRVEKTEKVQYIVSSAGKTTIRIENVSGRINIKNTTDTLEFITINAVKTAEVKYDEQDKPIENVKITIDSSGSEVKIETEIRNNTGIFKKGRGAEVDYDIRVPANMNISAENTNGTIVITGVKNDVIAGTVNGAINVYGSSGKLSLTSTNGDITCNTDSLTKGISIDVVNGDVKIGGLKSVNADVNASTVNGGVKFKNLNFQNLNSDRKNLSGTLGKGGNLIQVSTVNGRVVFDANRIVSKHDGNIELHFDFDDDDKEELRELEKIFEDGDDDPRPKIQSDTSKIPGSPKNADSLKK